MKTLELIIDCLLVVIALVAVARMSRVNGGQPSWAKEVVDIDSEGRERYGTKLWLFAGLLVFAAIVALYLLCCNWFIMPPQSPIVKNHHLISNAGKYCLFTVGGLLFRTPQARPVRTLCGCASGFGLALLVISFPQSFNL